MKIRSMAAELFHGKRRTDEQIRRS